MNLHKLNFLCAESVPAGKKKHRSIENELFWEASLLLEEKKKGFFKGEFETNSLKINVFTKNIQFLFLSLKKKRETK